MRKLLTIICLFICHFAFSQVNIQFGDVLMQTKTYLLKKELNSYRILDTGDSSITFKIDNGYILGTVFDKNDECKCLIITASGEYENFFINAFADCKSEKNVYATKWHCNGYLITHLNPEHLKDDELGKQGFVFVVQADH